MNKIIDFVKKDIILLLLVIIILGAMSFLLIKNARDDSATTDEPIHILSGYEYWHKVFSINPEHPPLGKQIAAIPLNFIKPILPYDENFKNAIKDIYYDSWAETRSYAQKWLYDTPGNDPDRIVTSARLMVVLFTVIFGFILFFTAKKWYGKTASIIAVFLFAFSPLILTHGHLANTDMWMTIGFFIAIFGFAWYLDKPDYTRMIVSAILFSIALLLKFSAVLLIPILMLIYLAKYCTSRYNKDYSFKKFSILFLVFVLVSLFMIWADYGFPTNTLPSFDSNKNYVYNSKPLEVITPILKYIPMPEYFKGLVMVFATNMSTRQAYIFGHSFNGGVWYYFPLAFLFKEPLAFIILIMSGVVYWIFHRKKLEFRDWILVIPVLFYILVTLFSKLNIGIRHLMPIYPFLFIYAGYFASNLFQKVKNNRKILIAYSLSLIALLVWYLFANLLVCPYYFTYFNELTGGPLNGGKYLADSNIDWGQDMKRLSLFLKEKNISSPVKMEYFWSGYLQPTYYGINYTRLAPNDSNQKGLIAIGVSALQTKEFSWLKNYKPYKIIGNALYVYNIE
jgi:hypothetical protein